MSKEQEYMLPLYCFEGIFVIDRKFINKTIN